MRRIGTDRGFLCERKEWKIIDAITGLLGDNGRMICYGSKQERTKIRKNV